MGRLTREEKARRDKLAEQGIKVCFKCKEEKPFSEFFKNKRRTYGFSSECKSCSKQYKKQHYEENKEQVLKKCSQYYQENKERRKEYYQKIETKDRVSKWHRERRQSDPVFRLSVNIRDSLRGGFKRKGWTKDSSTQEIIGCAWEQFVLWVGDEPSKENHLDHVIPKSLADTPEELKLLNHYTNFQLLPAEENISKGNRYIRKQNLKRVIAHHPHPDKLKEIVKRSGIELI